VQTSSKRKFVNLLGLEERLPQREGSATDIVNMTVDERTGGWDSRLGYEKFFSSKLSYGLPFENDYRTHSLFVWSTHGGARQYYLHEAESRLSLNQLDLRFTIGNPPQTHSLQADRQKPTANQPATSYVPVGRQIVLLNGYDMPARWDTRLKSTTVELQPLGWHRQPSPPRPWGVDTIGAQGSLETNMIVLTDYVPDGTDGVTRNAGLGGIEGDDENAYRWKVSWINENGSEGPMSAASQELTWTTLKSHPAGSPTTYQTLHEDKRHAIYLENISAGPLGTVARKIYRTKNLGSATERTVSELYYHVRTLKNNTDTSFIDYVPDSTLGDQAPGDDESILMPATGARFGAVFRNVLFIDGGYTEPSKIYYSAVGHPDTFAALNFFDVSNRTGGEVTAFHSFYNQLLVFRENAIDMVRGGTGSFELSPFVQGIGTNALDTVTTVPGVGVMFLTKDGVYVIKGGLDGGAVMGIEKMSAPILRTIKRMNPDVLVRATATYSHKWREWHCYFAVDGVDFPNFGIVYHVDKGEWSTREDFPVGVIDTDLGGNLIFGHNQGDTSNPGVLGDQYEAGLFVITRKPSGGHVVSAVGQDQVASDAGPMTSTYQSAWDDYGYPDQKKYVKYVYLYVMTKGDPSISLTSFKDFSTSGDTSAAVRMQRAEYPDQEVFDKAVWNTAKWENSLYTELRYAIPQGACSQFSFEISSTNDFILLGYAMEFVSNNTRTSKGKT